MRVWEGTQNSIARRISEITCRWISGGSAAESRCCCWGIQIRFIRSVRWHTGKAAHSGLDFEKGQSAVIELAKQIIEISKLVDLKRGLTLNVGVVQGGTRTNVIPAEAKALVDVRVTRMKDAAVIDRKLRFLKPFNRECKLEFAGGVNRPPMERTQAVAALYKKAFDIAKQLGWKLQEAAVGGGSDGNFTAALGIPTLDGLGAVGEGE